MRTPEELRGLFEDFLTEQPLWRSSEAPGLAEAMRYPVDAGGKRLRPVLCLAVGEAVGVEPAELVRAAAAVELVHTFSLVHDDLPALDDDAERRGRASTHVRFGEGVAILAGDALLTRAFELAAGYEDAAAVGVLAGATFGMIEGQYLDITGADVDLLELHRLKSALLFGAAVRCALVFADVGEDDWAAWTDFGDQFGRLFQLVDDLQDGDGAVSLHGAERTRELAAEQASHARASLHRVRAETAVVEALLDDLARRAL
jgi:geranylgeranyl diphosphate synthase, type II